MGWPVTSPQASSLRPPPWECRAKTIIGYNVEGSSIELLQVRRIPPGQFGFKPHLRKSTEIMTTMSQQEVVMVAERAVNQGMIDLRGEEKEVW